MSIPSSKASLIHDLFTRTADENYITARWCAANGLHIDFSWLALHALEKYFKSVLLLNGRTAKDQGHDIAKLHVEVRSIVGSLLPTSLRRPRNLRVSFWQKTTTDEFIGQLMRNGNAANRYLIYGFVVRSQDVHMLDQLVFSTRRLICNLDDRYIKSRDPNAPTIKNRQILKKQPRHYSPLGLPLDDLIRSRRASPARIAALNLNVPFAPPDFNHTPQPNWSASRNPVIVRRILEPLDSDDPKRAAEAIEIADWFLANVYVPKGSKGQAGVREHIRDAVLASKRKHGIP